MVKVLFFFFLMINVSNKSTKNITVQKHLEKISSHTTTTKNSTIYADDEFKALAKQI